MRKLEAVNGSGSRHLPRTWLLHTKVFQRTVFARRLSCADLGNVKQCFYKFSRHFAISFLFLSIYIIQNFLIKSKKCGHQFLPVLVNYGRAHFARAPTPSYDGVKRYNELITDREERHRPLDGRALFFPLGGAEFFYHPILCPLLRLFI